MAPAGRTETTQHLSASPTTQTARPAVNTDVTTASHIVRPASEHPSPEPRTPSQAQVGPQASCTPTDPWIWDNPSTVTWYVDNGCTLHLSGGTSPDYDFRAPYSGDTPWKDYANSITSISIDGDLTLKTTNSTHGAFASLSKLTSVTGGTLRLSGNAGISLFSEDRQLQSVNIAHWDNSRISDMSNMFSDTGWQGGAFSIPNFDTSHVSNMTGMFSYAYFSSLDLSNFNVNSVTNMTSMFQGCGFTSLNISGWNSGNVTNMTKMFSEQLGNTNLDLSNLSVNSVTNMTSMFENSTITGLNTSGWNTGNVTNMTRMFYGGTQGYPSKVTSLNLSFWNTSHVNNMGEMFYGCNKLTNLQIDGWDTSSVENMSSMFYGCSGLTNLDVSKFNTTNVTSTGYMFYGCSGLTNLDVSKFNTTNVILTLYMFYGCSGLTNLDVSKFNTTKDGNMTGMFEGCSGLTNLDVSGFNTTNVVSMAGMFKGCSGLTNLDVTHFNTTNVIWMCGMFEGCSGLTNLDVTHFNTAKVQYFNEPYLHYGGMFEGCSKLMTLDLSSFDTTHQASSTEKPVENMLPSGLRRLRLGPNTKLDTNAFAKVSPTITWRQMSSFADDSQLVSEVGDTSALATRAAGSDRAGYYVDKVLTCTSTITIDPNGGAISTPQQYTIKTDQGGATFSLSSVTFTANAPHGLLTGWKDNTTGTTYDLDATLTFNYLDHKTMTLSAQWKAMATPTISDINVRSYMSYTPNVNFTVHGEVNTTINMTTGIGGHASCAIGYRSSSCTIINFPASSLESSIGSSYMINMTYTTHDSNTNLDVTSPTGTKSGTLAYMAVSFTSGTGSGTPPPTTNALINTDDGTAYPTMPKQEGMTGPGGDTYLSGWAGAVSTRAPGSNDAISKSLGYTSGAKTSLTLTAVWSTLTAPDISKPSAFGSTDSQPANKVGLALGTDPNQYPIIKAAGLSVSESLSTGRPNGDLNSGDLAGSSYYTNPEQAIGNYPDGWDIGRVVDPTPGSTYTVTGTTTVTNPATGQRITKTRILTGQLDWATVSFAANGGTGTPPGPVSAIIDGKLSNSSSNVATLALPGHSGLTGPGDSWLGGWTNASDGNTYPANATHLVYLRGGTTTGAHTTLTLKAKWDTLALSFDAPSVTARPGATPSYSLYVRDPIGAPAGWSMSAASAVGALAGTCYATAYTCSFAGPVSDLVDPAPGTRYSVTATITAANPDTGQTVTATKTTTGILPYVTATFAKGGGTGNDIPDRKALVTSADHGAYIDLPDPAGALTGPGGAAFTGWKSGGGSRQPGVQFVPANGAAGGEGETIVAFKATWSTVAKPTGLTAAYHHAAGTVTLTGKAMGVGGDTVTACMTDGTGGTDTCRTARNPKPTPELPPGDAFTPITTGNPRVTTFQVDPNDTGSINITGQVDHDTTFTNSNFTTAHVRVCPAGAPAPATGAVPADCSEIITLITGGPSGYMTGARDNLPWSGRASGSRDQNHTTKDADFKSGYGYYDIWAYDAWGPSTTNIPLMGTPVKVYDRYHYTNTPPAAPTAASWDWSVSFPAADYTARYGAGGQQHLTASQTSLGTDSTTADLQGVLPWLKTTYAPDMPSGATATAPDPGKSLVDTSETSRPSDLTLARPTDSMEPADAVFLGWSATAGATTPDTGMGDPSSRDVTLSAPAGSPEADTTLHAVWRKLNKPTIDAKGKRDPTSKDATLTGNTTPWTNDEPVELLIHATSGQTGSALDTTQTPTVNTSGAYDGATQHGWTLTLPQASLPRNGRYQVSASAVGDDGAWRGVAHRYAKATTTQDVTVGGIMLHALPLTGGPARRLATLLALLLGATLLTLAAATKLRDRRREQLQGRAR
ncbi:BspA family leucine-rich repeat surface protein [Bifidobacterium sp. ESL0775]|nr:BspA family leucine-rich repeat surface protein [Bifidobacterium sp. ESL0775]WEV70030.1 BspA family leucine-rich repeat surface protein [Bifidobacterium sp. ESL0775]